jgi:hypothetical protein
VRGFALGRCTVKGRLQPDIGYMSGALKHFFDGIYYPCVTGPPGQADLEACWELGATVAAELTE